MKSATTRTRKLPKRETLTEAYEVRAFKDDLDDVRAAEPELAEVPHADPGAFEAIKRMTRGHGEQTVLPDDCQFGDNDLCYVES